MSRRVVYLSLVSLVVTAFLATTLSQPASAQVLYGSITGTVTDQTGAVVPGAQVTVTNTETGLKRVTTTGPAGIYRALDLPRGTYTIDVSASGFRPIKRTNVDVAIGQVNAQDVQLEVGAVTQEVTVQATAAVLQTEKADVHTTVTSFAIENLPTDPYRNFQTTALLTPGVFSDSQITRSYPNSYSDTPDRSLNIDANGLPPRINTTRVDGATNLFVWLPNHMLIVPPSETIQEVNVQTSNYDVEKGLTAGVATDVVTKSGTNDLHGTLYWFHSDNALDASNVFYPHDRAKAKHIQNAPGVTIGGPIKKDKLFFFANWDGLFERNNVGSQELVPPIADGSAISNWRGGDFSSALGIPLFDSGGNPINVCTTEGGTTQLRDGMVFDPTSGNTADGTGRCVFSSGGAINVIPAGRLDPAAMTYMGLIPDPNIFPEGHVYNSDVTTNYFVSTVQKATRNIFTGKIDWNQSDNHTIWGKWTGQNFNMIDPAWYGDAGGGYSTGGGHQYAQTMTVGHTWTISPSVVLTGHLGITRMAENSFPPTYGSNLGIDLLHIPGTNEPSNDPLYSGMPGFYIEGFSTLGDANSWQPVYRNDWTLTSSHNVNMVRGDHQFRFGVDISHNHLNHWQPEIYCCPRGYLQFFQENTGINLPADPLNPGGDQMPVFDSTGTAAGTGFAPFTQNSVALFDLGMFSESDKSRQYIKNTAKDTQFGLYFGDRWKVTPKFTMDLGVRYEYFPIITRDGAIKFELYDPSTNEELLGGLGGNSTHLGVTASKRLFTPRIGLAYRVMDKTVVRAGFAISNDTLPLERPLRGFYPLSIGAANVVPNTDVSGWQPLATFADGIPLLADPDISGGSVTALNTADVATMAPGPFKRGYVESWNFFIERQLPGQMLLSIGYVGNHFVHMMNGRNINPSTLGGGSDSQPLYAAFGRTAGTYAFQGYLDSHYNSLQASLNRRYSNGLFLQGSYTYSKAIGYTSDNSWENAMTFTCAPSPEMPEGCQEHNRQTLSFDHTHMLKMGFVYDLPFGGGKKWGNTDKISRAILGGWQVNGLFSAWSGSPLSPTYSTSRLHTPGSNGQTPDQIGAISYPKGTGPGQLWFDISAFAPVLTDNVFGNVGRGLSWLRGPGLVQLDASLFRHFKVRENWDLEFRFETQNVTNSPHFYNPNVSCSNELGACGGSMGQITSGYGERYVQLGLKLKF
jgi:hypothetical protein